MQFLTCLTIGVKTVIYQTSIKSKLRNVHTPNIRSTTTISHNRQQAMSSMDHEGFGRQANQLDYVFCRDFVYQQSEAIRLHGTVEEINSLMELINRNFVVRPVSNGNLLSALQALTVCLETTSPVDPITFDDLRNMLMSGAYRELARTTAKEAPLTLQQSKHLFDRLTQQCDLPLTAILVLLNVLGNFSGRAYELGVLSAKGLTGGVPTFSVKLHLANPDRASTHIIWIAKDCFPTHGSCILWSGIAPKPAPAITNLETAAGGRENTTNLDVVQELSDVGHLAIDPSIIPLPGPLDEQSEHPDEDDSEDKYQTFYKAEGRRRLSIPGAPFRSTRLPIQFLADITMDELITYYPEHAMHWPGLALLILHANIRCVSKGITGFQRTANVIQNSRKDPSGPSMGKLATRVRVREWLTMAVRPLLGLDYRTKEADHLESLYAAIEKDSSVTTVAEFINKHLWDPPAIEALEGLQPPVPLHCVGKNVIVHPANGQFKARVMASMMGVEPEVPAQLQPGQLHPMVMMLNDFTSNSQDLQLHSAVGAVRPTSHQLDRNQYPRHIPQENVITKHWADLYGEPLLWTLLKYKMADISKMAPEEAIKACSGSNNRKQFHDALRQRKHTALQLRAMRLGRRNELTKVCEEFEKEIDAFGCLRGRKQKMPSGTQKAEAEAAVPQRRLLRVEARSKRKRNQADDDEYEPPVIRRKRLPSLPALSPPGSDEEPWEFPPESSFRLKKRPGRYITVDHSIKAVSSLSTSAFDNTVGEKSVIHDLEEASTFERVDQHSCAGRMGFSFLSHIEDDKEDDE